MTQKLHNPYEALLRSIDFFSQNLHLEQITQYGFKLFEDLVQPAQAVLYLKTEDRYSAIYQSGFNLSMPEIPFQKAHTNFAVFSGFILEHRSAMERFFSKDILDLFNVEYIMPLISGNQLMGFIFYNGCNTTPKADVAFMTRFNHMLNLSLEKACRFLEGKKMKDEIDKRLFNLASLSHTTRLLLSELETENIYNLCIDVIRELTSSSATSFLTVDPVTGHLITRAYKDIVKFDKKVFSIKFNDPYIVPKQIIFHISRDHGLLADIFVNPEDFRAAGAQYVVLLITDRIIGCITIGEPVGTVDYDDKLLEQIENVAGLVHLALTNASQFEQILEQKQFMENQTKLLKKVNRSVKTINSAESLDELCQITMDTLQYAFGVEAGFIAAYSNGRIEVKSPIGFEAAELEAICQKQFEFQINDELLISYTKPNLDLYFCESLANKLPEANCIIIAPIQTIGWCCQPLGCIVILRLSSALREEQAILVDSLANSIAPVVKQFYQIEEMQRNYKPDPEIGIKALYDSYQHDKDAFGIDYAVHMKHLESVPFSKVDLLEYEGLDYVHIKDVVVIFSAVSLSGLQSDHSFTPKSFSDIVEGVRDLHINPPSFLSIERLQ